MVYYYIFQMVSSVFTWHDYSLYSLGHRGVGGLNGLSLYPFYCMFDLVLLGLSHIHNQLNYFFTAKSNIKYINIEM